MEKRLIFASVSLLGIFLAYAFGARIDEPVRLKCLRCIRYACTAREIPRCVNDTCGFFRMSKDYWEKAGRLTINRQPVEKEETYVNCAGDVFCSYTSVQNYVKNRLQDCNGDGKIDCEDHVAIHKFGDDCKKPLPFHFEGRFRYCREVQDLAALFPSLL